MTTSLRWLALAAALLLITTPSQASLKDIRTERLPQEKAIQQVCADVAAVEEFVRDWSDKWRYETPKEQVASLLKASLDELQKALAAAPNNEELLLLTGLVAQGHEHVREHFLLTSNVKHYLALFLHLLRSS